MKIFSLLDLKAGSYLTPFIDATTVGALRGFELAVNEGKSTVAKFPDDFCLMELGEFDQQTGKFALHESPLNLGSGRTVLKQPPVSVLSQ